MLKQVTCPVCLGTKRLRGVRKVGLGEEPFETDCWACHGSGQVGYKEDTKPKALRTIVPEGKDDR